MGSPQPTLDPRTNSNLWTYIVLNNIPSPGSIPRGGMRGFKRRVRWDSKMGKGIQGGTMTLVGFPPAEGEIAFQLVAGFDAQGRPSTDFEDWDIFVKGALHVIPSRNGAPLGLTIFHPALSSVGVTRVVVDDYSPPEHNGKGLYIATIKLREWQPPPPINTVGTVAKSAAGKQVGPSKFVQPPDIQQRLDEIAMRQQANKT